MPSLTSSGLGNAGERVRRGIVGLGDFFARTNFPQSQFSLYAQRILAQLNTGDTVASFNRGGGRVLTIGGSAVGTLNRGADGSLSLIDSDGSRADEIDINGSRIRTFRDQAFMQLDNGPIISLNFNEQLGMQSFSSYSPDFRRVETITAVGIRTVSDTDPAISGFLSGGTSTSTQPLTRTTTSSTTSSATSGTTSGTTLSTTLSTTPPFQQPTFTSITDTGVQTAEVTQAITPTATQGGSPATATGSTAATSVTQTGFTPPVDPTTLQQLTEVLSSTTTTTVAQQAISATISTLMTTLATIAQSPYPEIDDNFTGNGTYGNSTGIDGGPFGPGFGGDFNGTNVGGGDQADHTAAIAGSVGAAAFVVGLYLGRKKIIEIGNYCFGRGQDVALHVPAIAEAMGEDRDRVAAAAATVDNPMYNPRERAQTVTVAGDGGLPTAYTVPLETLVIGGGVVNPDYAAPVAPPRGVAAANGIGAPEYMAPDPNQPEEYAAAQQAGATTYAEPDDGTHAYAEPDDGTHAYAEPNAGLGPGAASGEESAYQYATTSAELEAVGQTRGFSSEQILLAQARLAQNPALSPDALFGMTASEMYTPVAKPPAQAADSVHHAAAANGLDIYAPVGTDGESSVHRPAGPDSNYAELDQGALRQGAISAGAPQASDGEVLYTAVGNNNTPSATVQGAGALVVSPAAVKQRASQGGRSATGDSNA